MIFGTPLIVVAIAVGFALASGLVVISLVPGKSAVTRRLEELERMRWDGKRSRTEAFGKLFTEEQSGRLRARLSEAGWYRVTPAKMGARIVGGAVMGLACGVALVAYTRSTDALYLGGAALFTFAGGYLPLSQLSMAVKERKRQIQIALPDLLDMLGTTVQAGLAFNSALAYAQEVAVGPLGDEIKAVLSELRLGRTRADALKGMAERVKQEQLSTTVIAIVQAERLGSNLAHVLDELSEETRSRRMMRAEEIANLMPTRMVIPMALFMLPALFVMIFGGIAAEYLSGK